MTKAKTDTVKIGPFRVAPHIRSGVATGRWYIDTPASHSPDGKRDRKFLATKTEATTEAKRMLHELRVDGAISGHGPKLAGIVFMEIMKRWLDEQADRVATGKKRSSTLVTDGYKLKALSAKFAQTDVAKIDTKAVTDYQKERVQAGCAAPTINGETGILIQLLRWSQERNLLTRLPKVENIPVPVQRVNIPTPEEMTLILDALEPRTRLLVRFLAETGCRKSEAFNLDWSDLDEKRVLVKIRRKEGFTPKTEHSDRDIPVTLSLMEALTEARREGRMKALQEGTPMPPWVFPGKGGVKRVDFRKALATAIKTAGVTRDDKPLHLTPHTLRKAMATWLHVRGASDALLRPRLGHAPGSRVTHKVYVNTVTDDMRAIMIDLDAERAARSTVDKSQPATKQLPKADNRKK
ncbi:tyrosine-type recombinase/integrase [Sinorhizobium medicae]|nr:tyrosine-type recombinase/integrase [Sinorhizobium medicae]MDX0818048.1 tyrosine-type recombinase/integrase [Sinorhizobium medicae]